MKHPAGPQFVEHIAPEVQPRDIFVRFLAASVGATDTAIANIATAPASRIFVVYRVMIKSSPSATPSPRDSGGY
jgi:hypothetical protein